jgi:hypothetical protein
MVKKGQRKWIKIGTGEKDRDRHLMASRRKIGTGT